MGGQPGKLLVLVEGKRALIRACGRASFTCSADFKRLVYLLLDRGCRDFVLELSECTIMDSTFLGILVRFAGTLAEGSDGRKMVLQNPSSRILDLITSLGMEDFFEVAEGRLPGMPECTEVKGGCGVSRVESAEVALEAHRSLMEANPENVLRFNDVAEVLRNELKRLREEEQRKAP